MCIQCESSEEGQYAYSDQWPVVTSTERLGELNGNAASQDVVAQLSSLASDLECVGGGSGQPSVLRDHFLNADPGERTRTSTELIERALLVESASTAQRVEPCRGSELLQLMRIPSEGGLADAGSLIWGSPLILGALMSCLGELAVTSTPSLARVRRFEVKDGVLALDLRGSPVLLLLGDREFGNLDRIASRRSHAATVIRVHTVRRCLAILGVAIEFHREPNSAVGVSLMIPAKNGIGGVV